MYIIKVLDLSSKHVRFIDASNPGLTTASPFEALSFSNRAKAAAWLSRQNKIITGQIIHFI